jgi:hypothetical protein
VILDLGNPHIRSIATEIKITLQKGKLILKNVLDFPNLLLNLAFGTIHSAFILHVATVGSTAGLFLDVTFQLFDGTLKFIACILFHESKCRRKSDLTG